MEKDHAKKLLKTRLANFKQEFTSKKAQKLLFKSRPLLDASLKPLLAVGAITDLQTNISVMITFAPHLPGAMATRAINRHLQTHRTYSPSLLCFSSNRLGSASPSFSRIKASLSRSIPAANFSATPLSSTGSLTIC